jgi:hypothetical protein
MIEIRRNATTPCPCNRRAGPPGGEGAQRSPGSRRAGKCRNLRYEKSGPNQYRLLTRAQWLPIASAAGQFLASAGAITYSEVVHDAGELLALGSLGILLLVCLHMLRVGVRGALPPTAHLS